MIHLDDSVEKKVTKTSHLISDWLSGGVIEVGGGTGYWAWLLRKQVSRVLLPLFELFLSLLLS
jgi:hypothetical protein